MLRHVIIAILLLAVLPVVVAEDDDVIIIDFNGCNGRNYKFSEQTSSWQIRIEALNIPGDFQDVDESIFGLCPKHTQVVNALKPRNEEQGYEYFRTIDRDAFEVTRLEGVPEKEPTKKDCGLYYDDDESKNDGRPSGVILCYDDWTQTVPINNNPELYLHDFLNSYNDIDSNRWHLSLRHSSITTQATKQANAQGNVVSEFDFNGIKPIAISAYNMLKEQLTELKATEYTVSLTGSQLPLDQVQIDMFLKPIQSKKTSPELVATGIPEKPKEAECGRHGHYVKLCYEAGDTIPYLPPSYKSEIYQFVRRTSKDVGEGYIIVVEKVKDIHPDEAAAQKRAENIQRLVMAAQTTNARYGLLNSKYPIAYDFVEIQQQNIPGEPVGEPKAYIFTQSTFNKAQQTFMQDGMSNIANTASTLASNLDDVEEENWESHVERLSERVKAAVNTIFQKTKIPVFYVHRQQPFTVSDEEQLKVEVKQALGVDSHDINKDILDPDSQIFPHPCANYILDDTSGVHLYRSESCKLRYSTRTVREAGAGEEAIALLESAVRNTEQPAAIDLLLAAHRLAAKGGAYETTEAELLAEHVQEHFTDDPEAIYIPATAKLIQDYADLQKGDTTNEQLEELISSIETSYTLIHPKMQGRAAQIVLQAASKVYAGDCKKLEAIVETYRSSFRSNGALNQAREILQTCQKNEILQSCKPLGDDTGMIKIVYVDDGAVNFDSLSSRLSDAFLRMGGIRERHANKFSFLKVEAPGVIAMSQGSILENPTINQRLLSRIKSSCPGTIYVILSDQGFYPITYAGSSILSTDACENDLICLNTYQSRSIGFTYFSLPAEKGTVTSPLSADPETSSLKMVFSANQRRMIDNKLGVET